MGSKTINWCDMCRTEGTQLTGYRWGNNQIFNPTGPGSLPGKNKIDICPQCEKVIDRQFKIWLTAPVEETKNHD